ncbi:MAG: hypothetical protein EOP07_08105 [Proteobacteria bacterium]|nr:MAG: hypothetical protein EOP07_08105 [Pseudomonadota bacterium]
MKRTETIIRALVMLLLLSACNDLSVIQSETKTLGRIDGIDRISAKAGDLIHVKGKGLSSDITVTIEDKQLALTEDSGESANFVVPEGIQGSIVQIEFSEKNSFLTRIPIVNSLNASGVVTALVDPSIVCDDFIFRDEAGKLTRGERACTRPSDCSEDGQTNCIATKALPSTKLIRFKSTQENF